MTTRMVFTGAVDRRYAWLGNDAAGGVDIFTELAAIVGGASSSVAVSTMTFNYGTGAGATVADGRVEHIAELLAQKAAAGVDVRIVGNGGHRFQAGYFRAQRGGALVADNNLAALVCRVSFQSSPTAPAGFMLDNGAVFGPRGGGWSYGWDEDVTAAVGVKGTPDASFVSPLLRECYARANSAGTRNWSIELPAGHYYVLVATGEAAYSSKTIVRAQGETIFLRKVGGVYQYFEDTNTGAGEFACSTVDGGSDGGVAMARRLEVTSGGRLELAVGRTGVVSYSSIDYIEIYRASETSPFGDPGLDRTRVQERALHHTKFVLVDAGLGAQRLWTGSHNLTPVDPAAAEVRSEDAIDTTESAICAAFLNEFNQWWGSASGAPDPANSHTGIFKTPVVADGTMASVMPGLTAPWSVRFAPSVSGTGGVNLYQTVSDFLGATTTPTDDVLLLMEQVTDGGTYTGPNGTFLGPTAVVTQLRNKALGGTDVYGAIGDSSPTESIFTAFSGIPDTDVRSWSRIHDKLAIVDARRDNPTRRRGKLLCSSMNWSQGAMHVNDEQVLLLNDPALANQALQRAMKAYSEAGIVLSDQADCVIVIDRSYSMNDPATAGTTKVAAARLAAKTFVDMLAQDGSQRIALVRFGATVEPFSPPSTFVALDSTSAVTIKAAIDTVEATLPIGNWTCYGLALQDAFGLITSAPTPRPRKMVVFLSDGKENRAPMAATVYPAMAAAGVEIHTTALGAFASTDPSGPNAILAAMAETSGGSFAQVDNDAVNLQKRFADVARDAMGMATILDPTLSLKPGQTFTQEFPVDMRTGTLLLVLLWGGQPAAPEKLTVSTPWGQKLTARSPGVTRRTGDGREVWRIDLARLGARPIRDVRGMWKIEGGAPRKQAVRLELCVFASDTGIGHLQAQMVPVDRQLELRMRVLDAQGLTRETRATIAYQPPRAKTGERAPKIIKLRPEPMRAERLEGVKAARIPVEQPGIHEMHLVVEGKLKEAILPARGKAKPKTIDIPFRREQVLRWFVPAPGQEGPKAS